jgi:lipopolysaccharide export system protein LptC
MLDEWELWACAQQVVRQHRDKAPTFVAERIGQLVLDGDEDGVATWKAIAERIDHLGDYAKAKVRTKH